jgi:hypothetical protein
MPTKTDRILSYLPGTFRALPRPTALYSIVDAFGGELLQAENSLAAVMLAHWVDHADRRAELIQDLACFAALYGLQPRGATPPHQAQDGEGKCLPTAAEETVEEFREHLKRYVRTLLEGTVTVQGILRVTAEALGLRIADDPADLDAWWRRGDDALLTVAPRGDDAARLLLGVTAESVHGHPAKAARIAGEKELLGEIALDQDSRMRLKVDRADAVDIALPARATLLEIVSAINTALAANAPGNAQIAATEGSRLTLTSPAIGPESRLEIQETEGDATPTLLGLPPRTYHGADPTKAQVSSREFDGTVDLSSTRYLRLLVDGVHLAEVNCASNSPNPDQANLEEIASAINDALGVGVASHKSGVLTLTSPSAGLNSSIVFQKAASQDVLESLFGPISTVHAGRGARRAEAVGLRDLSAGVDLSARSLLRVRIDDKAPVTVDCAGENPASTLPNEIAAALNANLGPGLASHDGRFVRLTSERTGRESQVVFEPLPEEQEAAGIIFGIAPRKYQGAPATAARLAGSSDLSQNVNLGALNKLQLAIDGGPLTEVDVRRRAADPSSASVIEIAEAVNGALGREIASDDGKHLILGSPTTGTGSHIAIEPLEVTRRLRFVTRAFGLDEAGPVLFGFTRHAAQGTEGATASLTGVKDLSRGVDLRSARYLRVSLDGRMPVEIDCAGARPRATAIAEILEAINRGLGFIEHDGPKAATSSDGKTLTLASPLEGAASRINFQPPHGALRLFGLEPGAHRGAAATGVNFTGTVDLSAGADLSAGGKVKLGIDGKDPVEIECASHTDPAHTSLSQIVDSINQALGSQTARHDGRRVALLSQPGESRRIRFETPASGDATKSIFGITAPRQYLGAAANPARIIGKNDLSGGVDLRGARTLRLAVGGANPIDIDCSAGAVALPSADGDALPPDPRTSVKLAQIVDAINDAFLAGKLDADAEHDGKHLIMRSKASGPAERLELLPFSGDDARKLLFGEGSEESPGSDGTPAQIEGKMDLLRPVNLAERSIIKIAVDGGRPAEIDVAGDSPQTTSLNEVVVRINSVVSGLASATEDARLLLTSPTKGETSRLELVPTLSLELLEYPPRPAAFPDDGTAMAVRHGDRFSINPGGAADADARIELTAPHGAAGPTFVNFTTGQRIQLDTALRPGERADIWRGDDGALHAAITAPGGARSSVPPQQLGAGPLAPQETVPFVGERSLSRAGDQSPSMLQLHNPMAASVLLLRARDERPMTVEAAEAKLPLPMGMPTATGQTVHLIGRVRSDRHGYWLSDADEGSQARLRAGTGLSLADHLDRVATVVGTLHQTESEPRVLLVESLEELFDVRLESFTDTGLPLIEDYPGVTIGVGETDLQSLARQIHRGLAPSKPPSQLVRALEKSKASVLGLPRGQSRWVYLDCDGARFNQARFNHARFAGSLCFHRGVFDVSRFSELAPRMAATIFAPEPPLPDPPVEVRFHWTQHGPGGFVVNLPADLPAAFGGRFNRGRFASTSEAVEGYKGVVTEPADDPDYVVSQINDRPSGLVKAKLVSNVEQGFQAVPLPIRQPSHRKLTGGTGARAARIFLAEKDVPGFIRLVSARPGETREEGTPGAWGNEILIVASKSAAGPARIDVKVSYQGARFENARLAAGGGAELPARIEELLRPGPAGVLQAKAAGIHAEVTRDSTAITLWNDPHNDKEKML